MYDTRVDEDVSRDRVLWLGVLLRGLLDANGIVTGLGGGENEGLIQRRAQNWLGSRDFVEVCENAGMSPNMILAAHRAGKFKELGRKKFR